jgi:hypothetical protein
MARNKVNVLLIALITITSYRYLPLQYSISSMESYRRIRDILPGKIQAVSRLQNTNALFGQKLIFNDDFENGIGKWFFSDPTRFKIIKSDDANHSLVLNMIPGGEFVHAIVKNSYRWNKYRVEADFLFPTNESNYIGFIYHFNQMNSRIDFGSIYVKGDGSYIRVNPHRDYNAQRTLYEEYKTKLTGEDSIRIGEWHHMKAEVIDNVCHFYVGDMSTPKITFDLFEYTSGGVGFKPRVVGDPVWIDNVSIESITEFSDTKTIKPEDIVYKPSELVTDWKVIGAFYGTQPEIEHGGYIPNKIYYENRSEYVWEDFSTDKRGCVVSGKLTEFVGGHNIAYFHTIILSETDREVNLNISSNEALAYWLNTEFLAYDDAMRYAWYDFWENPDHKGVSGPIHLKAGKNSLLIRVRGGKYAGGGFFVRLEKSK